MGIAALAALALGGAALAQAGDSGTPSNGSQVQERADDSDRGESGDESVTGPGADEAKAAALKVTGGGTANSVERDGENGAVWEVEVTNPDGDTVDVRLDEGYDVVVVEADSEE
ncbi:MAG: PepSY domain-containing protein [Actinomycetota bacterium]|nr:PepSY domain-containing protein [Actinomycetota bacterium]